MLGGQPAVFLSSSEKYKKSLAWPVRDALARQGMRGIIVADEPPLPRAGRDGEAKVESYLDASSAFVALCAPDYGLSDGTTYPRASIIDEIERARARPHLRDHCQVLTSPGVLLPSSISATYDRLDAASAAGATEVILKQIEHWGDVSAPARPPLMASAPEPGAVAGHDALDALAAGVVDPADHDELARRGYDLLRDRDAAARAELTGALHRRVAGGGDDAGRLASAALLEAIARLDAGLVPAAMIEALTCCPGYLPRACAANLLLDRAVVAPGEVPVEILGRLARPSDEDWYVWAPALAAAKELALTRRDAYVIFESLGAAAQVRDRHAAAQALADIAAVRPSAVAGGLAARLADDADPVVAARARDVMAAIGQVSDADRADCYGHFRA
jgi:hypothetical protein